MRHIFLFLLGVLFLGTLQAASRVYVDQAADFTITLDSLPLGLSPGDVVTWNGTQGDTASNLVFGSQAFDSLQSAINATDENGTVYIASGTYRQGTQIEISHNLTLQGDGANETRLDGDDSYRVIFIPLANTEVTINGISVTNGNARESGGGVFTRGSALTISNSTISENSCAQDGGGIFNLSGTLTITNSTISGNSAGDSSGEGGGIANNLGNLFISNSTISGNSARFIGGGLSNESGSFSISNSTISENSTTGSGGGIYTQSTQSNSLVNCTLSGNLGASSGGGLHSARGQTRLVHCTITNNSSPEGIGSGIAAGSSNPKTIELSSSIIAGNLGSDVEFNSFGSEDSIFSMGSNLVGTGNASTSFDQPGDLTGISLPLLSPLTNNGGPTLTHAPLIGSPAIDGGNNANIPTGGSIDQRGRDRINNDIADIGAVESDGAPAIESITTGVDPSSLPVDGSISISFDRPIELDTRVASNLESAVILRDQLTGNPIPANISLSIGDKITITPRSVLPAGSLFFVEILENAFHAVGAEAHPYAGVSNPFDICFSACFAIVYVDDPDDFEVTDDLNGDGLGNGDTVTWKPGSSDAQGDLVFGSTAYTSIQHALENVCTGGRVNIANGVYSIGTQIEITRSVTLAGDGSSTTVIDGAKSHRVINIPTFDHEVTIEDIAISNGSSDTTGGGVYNRSGRLTISNCTISGNSTDGRQSAGGGGIYNASGLVTVADSTLSGNSANGAFLMVNNNFASAGAAIFNRSGELVITNSTISDNHVTDRGNGGGVFVEGGKLTTTNSTYSGNSAVDDGGAIYVNSGKASITHCTITNNTAFGTIGSGIVSNTRVPSTFLVTSSVIAGNTVSDVSFTTYGSALSFTSLGSNLIGSGNGLPSFDQPGDQTEVLDPGLAPLSDNGGPTRTHSLTQGSPAVDSGNNSNVPDGVTVDQRGQPRIFNGTVDIGAFELANSPVLASVETGTDADKIPVDGEISLIFDQSIELDTTVQPSLSTAITLHDAQTGEIVPSAISLIEGNRIVIKPDSDLPAQREFYILIVEDALRSTVAGGLPFGGITNPNTLNFSSCPSRVYVDQLADFTLINDLGSDGIGTGDTVTWKSGSSEAVQDLVIGTNAFSSVQNAVDEVCANGSVFIAEGTYDDGSELIIAKNLLLQGSGATNTVLSGGSDRDTTVELGEHRVILIPDGAFDVTISGLTITDGQAQTFGSSDNKVGGGITHLSRGTLSITDSIFTWNSASRGSGGAIYNSEKGKLLIEESEFSKNSALGGGGAINNNGTTFTVRRCDFTENSTVGFPFGGGAILSEGSMTVEQSSFTDNESQRDGGAIHHRSGTATSPGFISQSTFTKNTTEQSGGGVYNQGALKISQSTFSQNACLREGGGIQNIGSGILTLIQSTLTENSALFGGGLCKSGSFSATTTINCVIAGNTATSSGPDIYLTFLSQGVNFIGNPAGTTGLSSLDLTFDSTGTTLSQVLGPLAQNGGSSLTHALPTGSPALDAGSNDHIPSDQSDLDEDGDLEENVPFDQRGYARLFGDRVDIGASEMSSSYSLQATQESAITEGNSGTTNARFLVTREGRTDIAGSVDWVIDHALGSATADDFQSLSGTISFSQDETEKFIDVKVTGDMLVELRESYPISISNQQPPGAQIGTETATGTIDNDDQSVISLTGNAVAEGDTGNPVLTYTATLSQPVDVPVNVRFITRGGSARPGEDFELIRGQFHPLVEGDSVTVKILPDNLSEADETVVAFLDAIDASRRNVIFEGDSRNLTATATILNDDLTPSAENDGLYSLPEDGALSVSADFGLLANDTDEDDGNGPENLTVIPKSPSSHGFLTINEDGSFSYTPNPDYFGPDSFTYAASDGTNESAIATVDIEVLERVDLEVEIDVLQDPLVAGGDAFDVFRVSVTNNGPSNATGVQLTRTSTFPNAITATSITPSTGSFAGDTWALDLPESASATLTFQVRAGTNASSGSKVAPLNFSGLADQLDSDSSNNSAMAAVSIISPVDTDPSITVAPGIELQSGLLKSQVTVTNNNSEPIPAFRLYVDNLPADIQVYNASGTRNFGSPARHLPYLLYNQALAATDSVTLSVEFFRPSLDLDFTPRYQIELLPLTEIDPLPADGGIPVSRKMILANGDYLIEIASIPGSSYAVEYSSDMKIWKRVTPSIIATNNRLQWIDNGPPKTESHPSAVGSRFYRLVLISTP